jgi:hypothetical protein
LHYAMLQSEPASEADVLGVVEHVRLAW